jgi:DHA1 family tetracycline resistance protein-like MFS transporter
MSKIKNFSLFLVLFVAFLDWMGIGLVYPMFSSMIFHENLQLLPPETSEAWRGFWLGVLLSAAPIAQFISSPILGAMSDQKGRKPLLKYSLVGCAIGYFLSAWGVWEESLFLMLLGRIIVGIGSGSAAVVGAVMADISKPETKAKNFGLLNMAYGFGFMVGPFLGGALSHYGYDKPFLFAALMTVLNLIFLLWVFKETHKTSKSSPLSLMLGISNLKKAIYYPNLRVLFLALFLFCCAWSFYWEFIPVTWIKEYGLNTSQVGNLYAYAAGIYAISAGFLIRPIVNRFPAQKVLFFGLFFSGLYIYVMLTHMPMTILWFYLPLQQFLISLLFPTATAAISNEVNENMQGETMGICQSVVSAAFALSPLLSGVFVGLSIDAPIIVGGSGMLLAAGIIAIFRK